MSPSVCLSFSTPAWVVSITAASLHLPLFFTWSHGLANDPTNCFQNNPCEAHSCHEQRQVCCSLPTKERQQTDAWTCGWKWTALCLATVKHSLRKYHRAKTSVTRKMRTYCNTSVTWNLQVAITSVCYKYKTASLASGRGQNWMSFMCLWESGARTDTLYMTHKATVYTRWPERRCQIQSEHTNLTVYAGTFY